MYYIQYLKTPSSFVKLLKNFLYKDDHIILYGPENSGKYTQALHIAELFSKSKLKYHRKIDIDVNNEKYYFNISDIHFDIDFELLGTNQFNIWLEFIQTISSIVDTQGPRILICKNTHFIKDELLTIFHTFMRDTKLKIILCTKHLSYLPNQVKEKCLVYNLKQLSNIVPYSLQYKSHCNKLVEFVYNQSTDLFLLRDLLYYLLTYNFDIHECLMYIMFELINKEYIHKIHLNYIFKKTIETLKYYNTNYRPIYHLELYILDLHALRQLDLTNANVNDKSTMNALIENI